MIESDVVEWVRHLVAEGSPAADDEQSPKSPIAIAIDGRSGAGKSQLAQTLAVELADEFSTFIVHLDDLYPGWSGLAEGSRRVASEVLTPWRAHGATAFISYDWASDGPGKIVEIPQVELLIIEGCGSGARWNRPMLDAILWIEAPETLRHNRAEARDGDVGPWWDLWAAQEKAHYDVEQTRDAAGLVFETS